MKAIWSVNTLGVRFYARGSARRAIPQSQLSLAKTVARNGKKPFKDSNETKQYTRSNDTKKFKNTRNNKNKFVKVQKEQTSFHYGEFGGLKSNPNKNMEMTSKLIEKLTSFEDLKLLPNIRDAAKQIIRDETLSTDKEIAPSPIQTLAVKRISKNLMDPKLQVHAIAADTGSGKTMAYLLPLIDYLKRQELEDPIFWDSIKDKAAIRSIILVPTHELVEQVYNTIQRTEELLDLHTFKWNIFTKYPDLINSIKNRVDILVTTPSKLLTLFNINMISRPERLLSYINFVVIDEADTLMDPSWITETHKIIRKLRNTNHLVFCSATIPNEFNKTLTKLFPTCEPITTPRLHKLPRKLDFKILDSSLNPFKGSRMKVLAQTLYAIKMDSTESGFEKRCIVFVNEKEEVPKIVEKLRGVYTQDVVGLTSNNTVEERLETITKFTCPPKKLADIKHETKLEAVEKQLTIPGSNIKIGSTAEQNEKISNNSSKHALRVLVTTDLMARGLNFQGLRNVILYDVPKTSIDLVHRSGRTARMKSGGRIFMIIDKKTKAWAKALPKIIKKNLALS